MPKFISSTARIVSPSTKDEGISLLRRIEECARVSLLSEDRMTEDSWLKFIKFVVMDKGDWSVAEHVYASVDFRLSRGIANELTRHRLFSYTQESTRFINYGKREGEIEFIMPEEFRTAETASEVEAVDDYRQGCAAEEVRYMRQLKRGVKPQTARDGLPLGLASTVVVTGNLRNWRHLFMMRTSKETHPEFRYVMEPLLKDFQERIPILFDDILPGYKQSEAQSKPR
jgi:thymidylate synthase (FAD)